MKTTKLIVAFALLLFAFTACNDDEDPQVTDPNDELVTIPDLNLGMRYLTFYIQQYNPALRSSLK